MDFNEITARLRSGRYGMKALARDINVGYDTVHKLKHGSMQKGFSLELLIRVTDWLEKPRDLRDKYSLPLHHGRQSDVMLRRLRQIVDGQLRP